MSQLEKIEVLCADAGLDVVADVASIVINRENLTALQVREGLEELGVEAVYERIVAPAVDALEQALGDTVVR